MEIPFDLINQLQISLRNHANLSSYDPNDTSFPNLPTAEETIAELDPSPPYLRCRHCNGRLLRGLQSLICVFCGREANKDVPPDPINFRNTLGCRWLLESLNLDGSEIVGPPAESNNSSRGPAAPKEEFPLSDLLDLEIKWISESEKFGSNVSNERPVQSKSSLILDGVNIENFFVEGERVATSNVFEEPSAPLKKIEAKESFQIHENLTLFENVQPTETAVPASEVASGYSDSDWGADFKSAASETPREKSTSNDPFVVSSNLSTHMDEVFRPRKETKYGKDGEKIGSGSMSSDLFADFNSGPNMKVRPEENVNPPSTDVDWFQDGNWQSSTNKGPANKTTEGGMDSFDDWNDFASSTSGEDPSNNSRRQATVSSDEKISEMDLFSSVSAQDPKNGDPVSEIRTPDEGNDSFDVWNDFTASTSAQGPSNSNKELDKKTIDEGNDSFSDWNDFTGSTSAQDPSNTSQKQATVTSDDMNLFSSASHSKDLDFLDSFSQPDLFTGAFSGPNGYTEENKLQPEASALDRASDVIVKDGGNSEVVERSGDVAAAKTQSDDVEVLMSQMHDLSFMLEKNLSIPPKSDELNSLSPD